MRRNARTDKNQSDIVKALRDAGCHVELVHQLKNLFDILVFYNGRTFCVEIKDGSLPPSKKKLTEGEQKCKDNIESKGVKYWIIESIEQAKQMINENTKSQIIFSQN